MADKKDKQKAAREKRGCIAQSLFVISAASSLLLALALIFMLLPQDLSDIEGYGEGAKSRQSRDLTAVLRESVNRGHKVTISEEELNRWIGQTLKIKQGGLLGGVIEIDGLAVRLKEDEAELVMQRNLFGLKLTHSMVFQVLVDFDGTHNSKELQLHGGPMVDFFPLLKRGGSFGKLTVPQGYLHLVKPAFFQLGEVYNEELKLIFGRMHDIELEDGKLLLSPRAQSETMPGSP